MVGRGVAVLAVLVAGTVLPAIPAQAAKVNCAKAKCLALTFDDGPGKTTPELLKVLKKAKVKATFFVMGKQVERRPSVLKRTVADGHAIGNHTYGHPSLPSLMDEQVTTELRSTQEIVERVAGITPKMFRPPYGHTDERIVELAAQEGMSQVMWTGTTLDWQSRDVKKIKAAVLRLAKRNGVILMHETVPQTVRAMPEIIKELKKRGYTLVTVPQLAGGKKLEPGMVYP
ncbi:polysaccharide deacetylase family protein [Nonomuraea endophytica]|uniref:Peptidoglycan/xylan/chitin deacetylase (PgdA/CDA1 family) n=1 Tax=Nonomuraea endophytica TaxID=714136 RepID=A0A7W7ZXA3_9ACTN|nr:polysaccharide deacetylase family protein [Nonomuraea endophytica]MBB5075005.1 peptidoglycan/xylan/chitin deacetylase (PgdA/CDA1 family) [Nonomuraea endophytica]